MGGIWKIREKLLPLHEQKPFPVKMTPLISFIITYHNEPEALLKACVESIQALRLSSEEAEIIVVDDGSSPPLTSPLGGRLIRQEQAGLSVARNTGLSHAKGRYIQFVDADDCLIPLAYETVLEQVRKEGADVVLFKMTKKCGRAIAPKGDFKSLPIGGEGRGLTGAIFLQHRNLRAAAWGYAFRREILGELRFYPGLLHEDELFTPQLFLRSQSLFELDVKAYFYRQHEGTITHSDKPEKIQRRLDDIHFIIKQLHSLNESSLERHIRQLIVDYLQNTLMLTHSFCELRRRARELRGEGFLPLPLRCYSMRYLFVASIANLI